MKNISVEDRKSENWPNLSVLIIINNNDSRLIRMLQFTQHRHKDYVFDLNNPIRSALYLLLQMRGLRGKVM